MTAVPSAPVAVLMGPQRLVPIVRETLDLMQVSGTVATITAGWQEREAEDDELEAALGRPSINLMLHARGEDVFREDPAFFEAHRAKQDRLRQIQELYRRRLGHVMAAARQMQTFVLEGEIAPPELVAPQLRSAIEMVRTLDAEHARFVNEVDADFDERLRPGERPAVARQREQIHEILSRCSAVAIAGGHIAILLNRLRLFGLEQALTRLPVMAWSAGAMVLTRRIVLFHDSPPQGRGNAEVLGDGLGLFSGTAGTAGVAGAPEVPDAIVLPHARRRLHLDDANRIAMLAQRFAPATCVALDEHCYIALEKSPEHARWRASPETRRLTTDGQCVAMEAA
jgi:peptidase E